MNISEQIAKVEEAKEQAEAVTPDIAPSVEVMVREIHAFCYKLDQLLAKLEKALPMFLASMPPDMARELLGG